MKAARLHQTADIREKPLVLEEVPIPEPTAGEIRVKVRACGVCRTDLHVIEGDLETKRMPVIPGHQIVGIVDQIGPGVTGIAGADQVRIGDRIGVAWLHCTCGSCRFCGSGRENLCDQAEYTGWTRDGGYAEFAVAPARFVYRLPDDYDDLKVAPLLCAGIIGYRCIRQCGIDDWSNARIGLYGFGAAAHIAIQIVRARGARTFVFTRDHELHGPLAEQLGAEWVGGPFDQPPEPLDAAIVFAPAGELVPAGLKVLDRGGHLVLGGIHMSTIPPFEYQDLYWERYIHSVANNTLDDGLAFLEEAARVGVETHIETFSLSEANEALIALKHQAIRGEAVLVVDG